MFKIRHPPKKYVLGSNLLCFVMIWSAKIRLVRKSKDYVYGIWVYKVLGIWEGCYRVKITAFMHETVNRGKK